MQHPTPFHIKIHQFIKKTKQNSDKPMQLSLELWNIVVGSSVILYPVMQN